MRTSTLIRPYNRYGKQKRQYKGEKMKLHTKKIVHSTESQDITDRLSNHWFSLSPVLHQVVIWTSDGYRNWYQYWGHCGLFNDPGNSPQPSGFPLGCGELPRSLMRPQWPKLRYQCLFNHDETKLMINKQILWRLRLEIAPKLSWLQHGYMCTSWCQVNWLFLLGNTCSNHCDVTIEFVTLNSSHTFHQNRQQNIHYYSWKTDKN